MVAGIGKRGFVVNPRSLGLTRVPFLEKALDTLADFLTQGRKV
jgi:hypothetical protein